MPAAIPFIIAAVISTVVGLAINMVLSLVVGALQKKPKTTQPGFDDRTASNVASDAPFDIVFGELRKGGTIVYKRTSSNRQTFWMVIALAGHQVDSIKELWMGNTPLVIKSDGTVSGNDYSSNAFAYVHLGTDTQTVDTNLQSDFPLEWTTYHRGRGIAYVAVKLTYSTTLYQQGIPNPSFHMRGYNQVYDPRTGSTGYSDNPILCARAFLTNTVFGMQTDENDIDDDVVAAEATACDELVAITQYQNHFNYSSSNLTDTFTVPVPSNDAVILATYKDPNGSPAFGAAGDKVIVYPPTGGTLPSPLVAGQIYYLGDIATPGNSSVGLYPTPADAIAQTNVTDITTSGSGGPFNIVNVQNGLSFDLRDIETTFTAVAATDIVTPAATLYRAPGSDLLVTVSSTTTLPAGLTAGTLYRTNGTHENANVFATEEGVTVDITSVGSGTHTMHGQGYRGQVPADRVDVSDSSINVESGGSGGSSVIGPIFPGRRVRMHASGIADGADIITPGIVRGGTYFISGASYNFHVRLALTREDALANKYVAFTYVPATTVAFIPDDYDPNEAFGMYTGAAVIIQAQNSGNPVRGQNPPGAPMYVIRRGDRRFSLADSLADAIAGTEATLSDYGSDTGGNYTITLLLERRYACAGVTNTDQEFANILNDLLTSCGGRFSPPGDKWKLYAGIWRVPTKTIDADDLRSGSWPRLQTRLAHRDAANRVTGTYVAGRNYDQPTNAPEATSVSLSVDDGGEDIPLDVAYPFTPSKFTVERLVNSELQRRRYQMGLSWPADAGLYEVGVNEVVCVNYDQFQLDETRYFEVVNIMLVIEDPGDGEGPVLVMDYALNETSPFIYMYPSPSASLS